MKSTVFNDLNHTYSRQWFRILFRLQGSVIPGILPRVLLCAGFALTISLLHYQGWRVSWPVLGTLVPSIVLGLLLVFRTNTAYERFWEGRKLWGTLINTTRNLARQIWVAIRENSPSDRSNKIRALKLLVAFALAVKLHLRSQRPNGEVAELITPRQFEKLQTMNNPPIEIAFWIADYLQTQHDRGLISTYELTAMTERLDEMINVLGGCERILKTPIPLAYSIHLKQLLLLYCLALPFQMVDQLGWWTALISGLISFAVFGIEAIGIEIENPFGTDPNDLPLDAICCTMWRNMEDLITLAPGVRCWQVVPEDASAVSLEESAVNS
ncbi:MAG TPA: bestrophin family ion channel [Trichocoleus sp.]